VQLTILEPSAENLSSSLEDYLEAIYNLIADGEVARSKDIAELLKVAKSSVTGALRTLAEKKLINYKPYGYVTLTDAGRAAAEKVARRHDIIKSFFVDILGVDDRAAHDAACKAEHALGPDIVRRLLEFTEFVTQDNGGVGDLVRAFKQFRRGAGQSGGGPGRTPAPARKCMSLSTVAPGQRVCLAGIDAGESLKSRLAAMGMVGNAEIVVVSNSSPGPVVVNIRGTRIALGRKMAEKVMVGRDDNGKRQWQKS